MRRTYLIALILAMAWLAGFAAQAAKAPAAPVDLNRASVAELQQLPGIGPSRAEAILRYRSERPFRRISDLLRVKGVGRRTFLRLRPFVTVSAPAPSATASSAVPPTNAQGRDRPLPARSGTEPSSAKGSSR